MSKFGWLVLVALFWILAYVCLDRGNWMGGIFLFPALMLVSLNKFYSFRKG